MKKLALVMIACFLMMGCATTGSNPVEQTSQNLDPIVETLSSDWLKASGFIRGMIGVENLPKRIVDQMMEIDSWFIDEDGEITEEVELNTFQKWYIAGVRIGHTGPVLRALIDQYAPGLLSFPEVITGLAFLGLGM